MDIELELFGAQLKLYIAHALGRLAIGDLAVVVTAGTPHRDEAFRACGWRSRRSHTSPIWKQEHYDAGSSQWSEGCSLCEPQAGAHSAHEPPHS